MSKISFNLSSDGYIDIECLMPNNNDEIKQYARMLYMLNEKQLLPHIVAVLGKEMDAQKSSTAKLILSEWNDLLNQNDNAPCVKPSQFIDISQIKR